jgi:hypothetical protein
MSTVLNCVVLLLLGVTTAVANTGATDAPFGLSEGMSLEQLRIAMPGYKAEDEFGGWSKSVPVPVVNLRKYGVIAPNSTGLCRVVGVYGPTSKDTLVLEQYELMRDALSRKYGESESLSFRKPNFESTSLISAVDMEVRRKAELWAIGRSPGLDSVLLEVIAEGPTRGGVSITYDFSNIAKCLEIINARATQGL